MRTLFLACWPPSLLFCTKSSMAVKPWQRRLALLPSFTSPQTVRTLRRDRHERACVPELPHLRSWRRCSGEACGRFRRAAVCHLRSVCFNNPSSGGCARRFVRCCLLLPSLLVFLSRACCVPSQVTCSRGVKIKADCKIAECEPREWDAVVCPGGMPGAVHLKENATLEAILKKQVGRLVELLEQQGRRCHTLVASCHFSWSLRRAQRPGLVEYGIRSTRWKGQPGRDTQVVA